MQLKDYLLSLGSVFLSLFTGSLQLLTINLATISIYNGAEKITYNQPLHLQGSQ